MTTLISKDYIDYFNKLFSTMIEKKQISKIQYEFDILHIKDLLNVCNKFHLFPNYISVNEDNLIEFIFINNNSRVSILIDVYSYTIKCKNRTLLAAFSEFTINIPYSESSTYDSLLNNFKKCLINFL